MRTWIRGRHWEYKGEIDKIFYTINKVLSYITIFLFYNQKGQGKLLDTH